MGYTGYSGYELLWIFFAISFAGWILETVHFCIKNKHFSNRGILNGPVCTVYGFAFICMTLTTFELLEHPVFLFIGCTVIAAFVEWLFGHLLEKTHHIKWWDYSDKKWNLDGYICLQTSVLWGILGVVGIKFILPLLLNMYQILPAAIVHILLWVCLGILLIDTLGSYGAILHYKDKSGRVREMNRFLDRVSERLERWIYARIKHRVDRAYPDLQHKEKAQKASVFAQGCSFYKIIMLFLIGSFLGDLVETLFCRVTTGVWMSRSSLVWGQFSIVWGLAMAFATAFLYKYREKPDYIIFITGTILGGAYEYICSLFTEIVFGTIFWDYSKLPFNLGGRINLLYCFFWGIAAVIWIKLLYPLLSKWIELIPMKAGKLFIWVFLAFMMVDISVTSCAMLRHSARQMHMEAQNKVDVYLDQHFNDEWMAKRYQNMSFKKSN